MQKSEKLSVSDLASLVLGSVIGWGAFWLPGTKFLKESGVLNTALGLVIGIVLICLIQDAYHTMLGYVKEDGGEFSYALKYLGKAWGFCTGWALMFCYIMMIPLNATAFVLVLRQIFGDVLLVMRLYSIAGYDVYLSEILFAVGIIFFFYYVNTHGLKNSARVEKLMVLFLAVNTIVLFVWTAFQSDMVAFKNVYITSANFSTVKVLGGDSHSSVSFCGI